MATTPNPMRIRQTPLFPLALLLSGLAFAQQQLPSGFAMPLTDVEKLQAAVKWMLARLTQIEGPLAPNTRT